MGYCSILQQDDDLSMSIFHVNMGYCSIVQQDYTRMRTYSLPDLQQVVFLHVIIAGPKVQLCPLILTLGRTKRSA